MILLKSNNGNNAICDNCNIEFKADKRKLSVKNQFCCQKCFSEFKIRQSTKQCDNCGKDIYRSPSHWLRFPNKFCSRKCNAEYHTGENHSRYDSELHTKECFNCGGTVTRARSKYCSNKCKTDYAVKNGILKKRIKVSCVNCGKEHERIPAHVKDGRKCFCSKVCQNKYHSERLKGENNPRFKHGDWVGKVKDYSNFKKYKGFTKKIRNSVIERDGNICKVCGKTKEEHGFNMHVHHIDYNKENNQLSNLICVCRQCHGKIHGDEKKWLKILLAA